MEVPGEMDEDEDEDEEVEQGNQKIASDPKRKESQQSERASKKSCECEKKNSRQKGKCSSGSSNENMCKKDCQDSRRKSLGTKEGSENICSQNGSFKKIEVPESSEVLKVVWSVKMPKELYLSCDTGPNTNCIGLPWASDIRSCLNHSSLVANHLIGAFAELGKREEVPLCNPRPLSSQPLCAPMPQRQVQPPQPSRSQFFPQPQHPPPAMHPPCGQHNPQPTNSQYNVRSSPPRQQPCMNQGHQMNTKPFHTCSGCLIQRNTQPYLPQNVPNSVSYARPFSSNSQPHNQPYPNQAHNQAPTCNQRNNNHFHGMPNSSCNQSSQNVAFSQCPQNSSYYQGNPSYPQWTQNNPQGGGCCKTCGAPVNMQPQNQMSGANNQFNWTQQSQTFNDQFFMNTTNPSRSAQTFCSPRNTGIPQQHFDVPVAYNNQTPSVPAVFNPAAPMYTVPQNLCTSCGAKTRPLSGGSCGDAFRSAATFSQPMSLLSYQTLPHPFAPEPVPTGLRAASMYCPVARFHQ